MYDSIKHVTTGEQDVELSRPTQQEEIMPGIENLPSFMDLRKQFTVVFLEQSKPYYILTLTLIPTFKCS